MRVVKGDSIGFWRLNYGAVDLAVALSRTVALSRLTAEGSSLGCKFEPHCTIEGVRSLRKDRKKGGRVSVSGRAR